MTEKELKQEVRKLKKLKLQCRAGTPERLELGRQIKELKNKMVVLNIPEPLKEPIIAEILRIEAERKTVPTFKQLGISLQDYSLENLKIHLKKLNTKKGVK